MTARVAGLGGVFLGPLGALVDPAFDESDLLGRQGLALGRHPRDFVGRAGDGPVEQAFVAIAWHDIVSDFAAGEHGATSSSLKPPSCFFAP